MQRPRLPIAVVPLLIGAFVGISSFLGLNPGLVALHVGLSDVVEIWEQSRTADVIFVLTTTASAVISFALGMRSLRWGIVLGISSSWVVYAVSYMALPDRGPTSILDVLFAFLGVAEVGFLGLLFAGMTPPITARLWVRRGEVRRSTAGVVEFEIVDETRETVR